MACWQVLLPDAHIRPTYGRELSNDVLLFVELMKGAFVMKAEFLAMEQGMEYACLHPSFKLVDNGVDAPRYWLAWQGTRFVLVDNPPKEHHFECPSTKQHESWTKTMLAQQKEHPLCVFRPSYP